MTAWPDRFVYVCSASQASIVNAFPLLNAGLDRVAAVALLCGAKDRHTPDPRLRGEAIEPGERLERNVAEGARPRKIPFRWVQGDAGRFAEWAEEVRKLVEGSQSGGRLPIVYNITGGTKQMLIGALYGCLAAAQGGQEILLVQTLGSPLRVEFLDLDAMTQTPAPGGPEPSLAQYLSFYGLREAKSAERTAIERFYAENRDAIGRFAAAILPRFQVLAPIFSAAAKPRFPDARATHFEPGPIDPWSSGGGPPWARTAAAEALRHLNGVGGLALGPAAGGRQILQANARQGAWLVRSQWLEAELYNRICAALAGKRGVSVAANVRLHFEPGAAADHASTISEFDVAVMIRGQLHVVEAKVAEFGAKARAGAEHSLAQLEAMKKQILGQFGRLIAVNPRYTEHTLSAVGGAFPDRARRAGIVLLLGPDAVDKAVRVIERLAAEAGC